MNKNNLRTRRKILRTMRKSFLLKILMKKVDEFLKVENEIILVGFEGCFLG